MKTREELIEEARVRHGKPFHVEIRQERRKPKSAFLRRLERLQAQEAAKQKSRVTRIDRRGADTEQESAPTLLRKQAR